jgi:hypothetical protein
VNYLPWLASNSNTLNLRLKEAKIAGVSHWHMVQMLLIEEGFSVASSIQILIG